MNKSQIILAAIGGVTAVGALGLAYCIWSASSDKSAKVDELETSVSSAKGTVAALPVKPNSKELKAYDEAVAAYDQWRADAELLASRGDQSFETMTSAELKNEMVSAARRIASRPGCFEGKFVKPDFNFGFGSYITGADMPPSPDKLEFARLQREWNDVAFALNILADCGAIGLTEVTKGKPKTVVVEEPDPKKDKNRNRNKNRNKKKDKNNEEAKGPTSVSFTVEFIARPSAMVKAINGFATCERFVVVEDFSFVRESDTLAEKLGVAVKQDSSAGGGRGGRRRRAAAVDEESAADADDKKVGIVTNPQTASPFRMRMVLSVYDFGSLERAMAEAEKTSTGGQAK